MNVAAILKHKGREVFTVKGQTSLSDVVAMLAEHKIGAAVVIDDERRPIGIVSERDIVRNLAQTGAGALQIAVADMMTDEVVTCCESDTIDELMSRMTARRFRHLPVVADGRLAGLISIGDVVKHHIAAVEMEASALRSYISTG